MLQSGYESPDRRRSEATSSRPLPAGPRFLVDPTPATLLPLLEEARGDEGGKGKGNDLRTRLILRHAIRRGIERGDVDLITWLIALEGDWVSSLFNLSTPSPKYYLSSRRDGYPVVQLFATGEGVGRD